MIDIFNKDAINHLIKTFRPEVVLNLVANTNIESCENYFLDCIKINSNFVVNLCEAIHKYSPQTHLVHISTDHVYGGIGPHTEDDINLINCYAISKYLGEKMIDVESYTILRTNFFGKGNLRRNSLSDWIINSLINNKSITLFNDVYFSPLHVLTLVDYIYLCINIKPQGIFNLGSNQGLSKADFGMKLISQFNLPTENISISSIDHATNFTRRPKDMRMSSKKIELILGKMPTLESQIELAIKEYVDVSR
jgi:dTDP-4-dehydrorhamnose reductase